MDINATLYWAPVVPNGAVNVQGAAVMAFLWLLPGLMWDRLGNLIGTCWAPHRHTDTQNNNKQ